MKKTLILISIFMIMLVSCSGKNKTADKAPAKQTVGLPNPIHESSAEEIAEQLSVNFAVPDGAKDVRYSIIAGNLAQMDFIWNDAECTARIEHKAESEDISGFYYNWSNETSCNVGENTATVKWQITEIGEVVGICIW